MVRQFTSEELGELVNVHITAQTLRHITVPIRLNSAVLPRSVHRHSFKTAAEATEHSRTPDSHRCRPTQSSRHLCGLRRQALNRWKDKQSSRRPSFLWGARYIIRQASAERAARPQCRGESRIQNRECRGPGRRGHQDKPGLPRDSEDRLSPCIPP